MKKRLLYFIMAFVFIANVVVAQTRTITGTVTDKADGGPIPGVSILVKGSSIGAQTNAEGKFSIAVPQGATLVFKFVGYSTKEVTVGSSSIVNAALEQDSKQLGEVVVVGYGTKSTRELTGAVSNVKGDKIASTPVPSFDQALSGKTAGVQISSSGGVLGDGVSIRVRGINSISQSSLPLVVIDGIPANTTENVNQFNSGNGTRFNPLALINPNDIESIDVLKDAGASVIYGSRAANGVILITTKKGKNGNNKITFESKTSMSEAAKLPSLLSGDVFNTIQNEKAFNKYGQGNANSVIAKDSDIDGDGIPDRTNWLDYLYRTGYSYDNTLSLQGGTEKSSYFASARYSDQEGINIGNRLRTGQARLNLDITPIKWIKSGVQLSYTKSLNNGILTDRYLAGTTVSGYNAFPTVAVSNSANILGYNLSSNGLLGLGNNTQVINGSSIISNSIYNSVAAVNSGRNNNTAQNVVGNIYLELQPIEGLRLTSKYGIDYLSNFEDQYNNPNIAGLGRTYNGLVQNYFLNRNSWTWQNYASFDKVFAQKHKIGATAGLEYQYVKQQLTYTGGSNFADAYFINVTDNTFTGTNPTSNQMQLWSGGGLFSNGLASYFGRLSYMYNGKYYVEGAYRTDAYSGFSKAYRWGKFPSVSFGWIASEENFMKDVEAIQYLKIRGSYGRVGNSRGIGSYASQNLYGGGLYTTLNGLAFYQVANESLRWESSLKFDIGAEVSLLKGRLNVNADYFNNNVSDLILAAPVLHTVGVPNSSINTNIGSLYNRGVELTLSGLVVDAKDFKYNASLNFTYVKNEVTGLVNNEDISDTYSVASVGRALGTYKLIRSAGVDPQTGNAMWYDKAGVAKMYNPAAATSAQRWTLADGTLTSPITASDAVYLDGKQGTPKYYAGFDNTFSYKGFELGLSFLYSGGNYIYNATKQGMLTNFFQNNFSDIENRWTTPGQVTDVPKLYLGDNTPNQTSDRFLEKGDFLRMKNISLAYNFKPEMLKNIGVGSLRVYVQAYNAFVITGYSGADPEVNYNRNNSNISVSVDNRSVPQPRTYTMGVNVSF